MKTTNISLVLFFCVSTFFFSNAQVKELIGIWNLNEFTFINAENKETMDSNKLKEDGSVWDLFFMEEGKFKQTSNMSESGTMDSQEGVWETFGGSLKLFLDINGRKIELNYIYELKDNSLILNRSNPMGTMQIMAKFIKK